MTALTALVLLIRISTAAALLLQTAPSTGPTTAPARPGHHLQQAGPVADVKDQPGSGGANGARGPGDPVPPVYLLAPGNVGKTIRAQPVVYWYLGAPTDLPIHLTINRNREPEPLLEKVLTGHTSPGFKRLSLADEGITLAPGNEYEIVIAIRVAQRAPSRDRVSSGFVEFVPDDSAVSALAKASADDRADVFAEHGIWYDCLAEVFAQIEKSPNDAEWLEARRSLLEQIRLNAITNQATRAD